MVFGSKDLTRLIGIGPNYLNRFIEREQFRIASSVRGGLGRGSQRLFSIDDVYGIALVWWLFESGLRALMIQRVLDDICGQRVFGRGSANEAAKRLLSFEAEALLIQRRPRIAAYAVKQERTPQNVELLKGPDVFEQMRDGTGPSTILLRVGELFSDLKQAMNTQ